MRERLLSPRVLHFVIDQIAWECQEFGGLETLPNGLPETLGSLGDPGCKAMIVPFEEDTVERRERIIHKWSHGHLTQQSDKCLPKQALPKNSSLWQTTLTSRASGQAVSYLGCVGHRMSLTMLYTMRHPTDLHNTENLHDRGCR